MLRLRRNGSLAHQSVGISADCLMAVAHIVVEGGKDGDFEKGVKPRTVDEAGGEEHYGAGVVGQRVGHPHQGEALLAEGFA